MKKDAEIIGVWGGRGSGKSTRLKELTKNTNRNIVFDPIGDWAHEKDYTAFKTLEGMYRHIAKNWINGFRCVLVVDRKEDAIAKLNKLSDDLFTIQKPYYDGRDKRKLNLIIEEMAQCVPNEKMPIEMRNFLQLCNLGRHYGVQIYGASQRLAEVSTNFRGNASQHYFFRMGSAVDGNAAMQLVGRDQSKILYELQTHEFLHFQFGNVTKGKNEFLTNQRRKENG